MQNTGIAAATFCVSLLLGQQARADVPTQWTLRVLARDGGATAANIPADSAFSQSGIFNDPGLDTDGSVALRYTYQNSTPNKLDAYFRYNAAANTTGSILSGTPNVLYSNTLDFKAGRLLLLTQGLIGSGEVRASDGTLERAVGLGGPLGVTGSITNPRLTPDGSALFRATASNGAGGTTTRHLIDRGVGGARTQVSLADSTVSSQYSLLYPPASNDNAQLASKVMLRAAGQTYGVARFSESSPAVTVFSLADNPVYDSVQDTVAINNAGQVAFWARRAGVFQWELLRANADSTRTSIALAGTRYSNAGFGAYNARINNAGHVAFRAEQLSGGPVGNALFVSDGPSTARVAGDGTTLTLPGGGTATIGYGLSTSRYTVMGNFAFNGNRIAFIAKLSDNSNALVLATAEPPACGPSDFGGQGGVHVPDGQLDNNDFVVFIDDFFNHIASADVGVQGGVAGHDGQFDNNDFVVFIDRFFAGCT